MLLSFGASTEEPGVYEELRDDGTSGNRILRRSTASFFEGGRDTSSATSNANTARCCCCRRSNFRLAVYIVFFAIFLAVGSICFMTMEGEMLSKDVHKFRRLRKEFLDNHACVDDEDLEDFIKGVSEATSRGLSLLDNATYSMPNWSFGQAVFYATTLVTTIGYGRITPISGFGKLFSIFYAVVGIPLTMILFTALVERLYSPTKQLLDWLTFKLENYFSFLHIQLFHLSILATSCAGFFFFLPAVIFWVIEPGWNYLDAFYYCFISLTTIGLGDYVPGDQPHFTLRPLYKICTVIYLFSGITFVILTLRVFHEITELNVGGQLLSLVSDEPASVRKIRSRTSSTRYCYGTAALLGATQTPASTPAFPTSDDELGLTGGRNERDSLLVARTKKLTNNQNMPKKTVAHHQPLPPAPIASSSRISEQFESEFAINPT